MKKADIFLFIGLIAAAFIIFLVDLTRPQGGKMVLVTVEGKETEYPFKDGKYVLKSSIGTNIMVIKGNEVYIKEATCPDKLCMRQGRISRAGEVLVCIPNKIVIRIVDDDGLDAVTS